MVEAGWGWVVVFVYYVMVELVLRVLYRLWCILEAGVTSAVGTRCSVV